MVSALSDNFISLSDNFMSLSCVWQTCMLWSIAIYLPSPVASLYNITCIWCLVLDKLGNCIVIKGVSKRTSIEVVKKGNLFARYKDS